MRLISELIDVIREKHVIIKDWDMSDVRRYLELNDSYTAAETQAMEREYKRFIAMSFAVEKGWNIPISDKIDPFWHTHIMFTHDYTQMCHALGGQYIHHVPALTAEQKQRLCNAYTENTLPIYRQSFGELDATWWPEDASICIVCCDRDAIPKREDDLVLSI